MYLKQSILDAQTQMVRRTQTLKFINFRCFICIDLVTIYLVIYYNFITIINNQTPTNELPGSLS